MQGLRGIATASLDWYERHRRAFWILHSIWALVTGAAVIVAAHNRYGFVPWVVAFLGLTWISTLFFSRHLGRAGGESRRTWPGQWRPWPGESSLTPPGASSR